MSAWIIQPYKRQQGSQRLAAGLTCGHVLLDLDGRLQAKGRSCECPTQTQHSCYACTDGCKGCPPAPRNWVALTVQSPEALPQLGMHQLVVRPNGSVACMLPEDVGTA